MTPTRNDPAALASARLRRASWIAGGMAALALAGALWLALTATPRLTPPTLPVPNGFDDALRAAEVIRQAKFPDSRTLDVTTADAEALRPWVEANREAVGLLREAIGRPFQVPVSYDLARIADEANRAGPLRTVAARALFAEGRLARLEGRHDEAARAFLDLIRLGNAMGRDVPAMPYMASLAPIRLGLVGLRSIRDEIAEGPLAAAVAELEELDRAAVPASAPIRLEQAFVEANVNRQLGSMGAGVMRLSGGLARQQSLAARPIENASFRSDALRRLVLAELALRLHRLREGADPESLDALVPSILRSVPIDPHTGRPLLYRKTPEGARVYSAGPDGDDDGLEPTLGVQYTDAADGDLTADSLE